MAPLRASLLAFTVLALAGPAAAFLPHRVSRAHSGVSGTPTRPVGFAPRVMPRSGRQRLSPLRMDADYYGELGVSRSATIKEIKAAFRKAATQCHPDTPTGKTEEAKERWLRVNRAYEVLGDEDLRKKYDMYGEAGVNSQYGGPGGPGGQQVDLSDIFDSFFGGMGGMGGMGAGGGFGAAGGQRRRAPTKGDDLRFDLEVDFNMACFGGKEKIRIRHLEKCNNCDGSGVKPGSSKKTCGTCNGMGVVTQVTRTPLGQFQTQSVCPTCRGEGTIIEEYCNKCSGQGTVQVSKQITLTVPPGVETSNRLRVRGEGDASPNGGETGDLYIFITVKEDKKFRREGMEIYSDLDVNFYDAVLGTEMKVKTIDSEVKIKIPPGSQPDTVLRMKGHGAPKLGGDISNRGNHYVTIKIKIPEKLSKRERELMEELRKIMLSRKLK